VNNIRSACMRVIFLLLCSAQLVHAVALVDVGDLFQFSINGLLKPESGYAKNANLINSDEADTTWFVGNTTDIVFNIQDRKGYIETKIGTRNKFKAGDPKATSSTSKEATRVVDSLQEPHSHASGKLFFWAREIWMRWNLGNIFNMPFTGDQYFTIGLFPFQVGRGIALGDVFAAGSELLGFYSETYVDQYAFGMLFSGDIWSDWITYALYAGLLKNKNGNFKDIQEKVYTSRYGHRDMPQRGFGDINYVIAGYFDIYALHDDVYGSMRLQPYWVFNQDGGQKVEFQNDATSILGTIGLEGEYLQKYFEFGFEMAFNAGKQAVHGWDRNAITLISNEGRISQVNSHVIAETGDKVPYVKDSAAQKAIIKVPQTENSNGERIPGDFIQIGYLENPTGIIKNGEERFRDGYCTIFNGWMILADTSFWVIEKDLRLSFTAGVASGDVNPNYTTKDGNYQGFIGLQEAYSGKRVKFAFPTSKIERPIANPINVPEDNVLTNTLSGFTNLIFVGTGIAWSPVEWENPIKINPNVIAYWQQHSVPKIEPLVPTTTNTGPQANPFLGVEMNLFVDYNIVKNLKIFGVMSVFIPGTFYSDIKGRRASYEQAILETLDADSIPKYGNDAAFTLNIGLEYRF
jgi:hypothetical protein